MRRMGKRLLGPLLCLGATSAHVQATAAAVRFALVLGNNVGQGAGVEVPELQHAGDAACVGRIPLGRSGAPPTSLQGRSGGANQGFASFAKRVAYSEYPAWTSSVAGMKRRAAELMQ